MTFEYWKDKSLKDFVKTWGIFAPMKTDNRFAERLIGVDRDIQGHPVYFRDVGTGNYGEAKTIRYVREDVIDQMLDAQVEACAKAVFKAVLNSAGSATATIAKKAASNARLEDQK